MQRQRLPRAHASECHTTAAPSVTLVSPVVFLQVGDARAAARPSTGVHGRPCTQARKRRWPSYHRRDAAVYLVSFVITLVALGFGAYFYAQWTLGLT